MGIEANRRGIAAIRLPHHAPARRALRAIRVRIGMPVQHGYDQQMGNDMYGGSNSAYVRRPVNDRGARQGQRGGENEGKKADYRELI